MNVMKTICKLGVFLSLIFASADIFIGNLTEGVIFYCIGIYLFLLLLGIKLNEISETLTRRIHAQSVIIVPTRDSDHD